METIKEAPNTFLMTAAELDFLALWGQWRADNSRDRMYWFNLEVYRMDVEAPFMIRCSCLAKLPDHVKTEVRAALESKLVEINAAWPPAPTTSQSSPAPIVIPKSITRTPTTSPQPSVTPKDLAVAHAIAFGRWLAANAWEGQGGDVWHQDAVVGYTEKTTADLYIDYENNKQRYGI